MKAQSGEGVQVILLGDNICGKEVLLRPINFHDSSGLHRASRRITDAKVGASLHTCYHLKSNSLKSSYPSVARF